MTDALEKVRVCSTCGNIDSIDPCSVCCDPRRDGTTIVVVEDVSDLWALERAAALNARYHVLGGTLSPLDGIGPGPVEHRGPGRARRRRRHFRNHPCRQRHVEGQTTAHYLTDQLSGFGVKVTRLAHGVPVGGELDYLDEGTLAAAMKSRTAF